MSSRAVLAVADRALVIQSNADRGSAALWRLLRNGASCWMRSASAPSVSCSILRWRRQRKQPCGPIPNPNQSSPHRTHRRYSVAPQCPQRGSWSCRGVGWRQRAQMRCGILEQRLQTASWPTLAWTGRTRSQREQVLVGRGRHRPHKAGALRRTAQERPQEAQVVVSWRLSQQPRQTGVPSLFRAWGGFGLPHSPQGSARSFRAQPAHTMPPLVRRSSRSRTRRHSVQWGRRIVVEPAATSALINFCVGNRLDGSPDNRRPGWLNNSRATVARWVEPGRIRLTTSITTVSGSCGSAAATASKIHRVRVSRFSSGVPRSRGGVAGSVGPDNLYPRRSGPGCVRVSGTRPCPSLGAGLDRCGFGHRFDQVVG